VTDSASTHGAVRLSLLARRWLHPSPAGGGWSAGGRPGGGRSTIRSPAPTRPLADARVHPPPAGEGWSKWRRTLASIAAAFAVSVGGFGAWVAALGPAPSGEGIEYSTLVVDREGRLLRPYPTFEGRWRLPASIDSVDPRFFALLFAYEDKRFRSHFGVDPGALVRAAVQFVANGRIVSGGSTLTMQVARLLEPRSERNLAAKLRQAVRALALEGALSKDEILALYLSLAPYGGNLEGIRAASLSYFGKEPRRLTLSEAALLVALPQSPEARRPDRSSANARSARDRVLDRVAAAGLVPPDEIAQAKAEPVPTARRPMPALAPHAADQAIAAAPERRLHRLTIDANLQRSFEDLARDRARAIGPEMSVAIIAVDNATGEVLARVASADYFDESRAGQVDMTQALRSPGSTLKPFIYGIGFEDGLIHPDTLIDDRPTRFGTYAPENFDSTFQGVVTIRKALQLSLNVPAVAVLDAVRASRLTTRLAQAGSPLVLPKGEQPGLAMGLGGVGVRLADLTRLYAGLARLGTTVPLLERRDDPHPATTPQRLLDPVAAWYVGNVLMGTPPPVNAAGGRIAFKTGTSYGYRDAWSVGFDGRLTIGVWVGRPDGAPFPGLIGRAAAAPILFDAFTRIGRPVAPLASAPKGAIFAATAKLPPPLQRFRPGALPTSGPEPVRILFPPNGSRLELVSSGGKSDPVALKVQGGVEPLTVLVNGVPFRPPAGRRTFFFDPEGPGFVRLTVMDARGLADSVVLRIQ
jgi:penicillin-binding protein 1C